MSVNANIFEKEGDYQSIFFAKPKTSENTYMKYESKDFKLL